MIFKETAIPGVVVIELEPRGDERGFFARTFCERAFSEAGLQTRMVNTNMSYSRDKHTLRGMHWQQAPSAEVKVVRCTRGRVFDVAVDIRPTSPTFLEWVGSELSGENRRMLYVPEGFAHGFMTLEDHTEVSYQVSNFYDGERERGIRWDDSAVGIHWPEVPAVLSEKDLGHPDIDGANDPRFG